MATPDCKGRYISRNPTEELFFSINDGKIKAFTEHKINELATKKITKTNFLNEYTPELHKEIEKKFTLTEETKFLVDNIAAPIVVYFLKTEK